MDLEKVAQATAGDMAVETVLDKQEKKRQNNNHHFLPGLSLLSIRNYAPDAGVAFQFALQMKNFIVVWRGEWKWCKRENTKIIPTRLNILICGKTTKDSDND